jgi:hypothetical protein
MEEFKKGFSGKMKRFDDKMDEVERKTIPYRKYALLFWFVVVTGFMINSFIHPGGWTVFLPIIWICFVPGIWYVWIKRK